MIEKGRIRLILTWACLFTLLLSAAAHAQTRNAIRLNIPFAFVLDGEAFEPGEYTISRASQANPRIYVIKNGESGAVHRFRTHRVEGEPPGKLMIVFNQYGDHYFLSELWWKGNENGRQVFPCAAEMEARERASNERDAPQLRRVVITD